jgi:nitrite reductase/ring-hydroxylating ferredoxin subunit
MRWVAVEEPVPTGETFIKKVKAGGRSICLVGYGGDVFALGSSCPHAGFDLSKGWCKEGKLVCPIHRFSYDLQTGKGSPGQNDYIERYPVKVTENVLYVGIESFWDKLKQAFR